MSRIGRAPIAIPAGVDVKIEGNLVTVKGSKGTLDYAFNPALTVEAKDGHITVTRPNDEPQMRSLHGLTRTLISNMVIGVTQGYSKQLEIIGVGYRVAQQGKTITFNLGYSHVINITEPEGIKFEVPNPNTVVVKGIDKQAVGQMAAIIRSKRPPEPYHGKGVRYTGERVRHKAGKAGGKGK